MPNIRHSYPGRKALRPPEEESEEESSEEEEEEVQQVAYRGSGKQLGGGGGGKYLRPSNQDDDDDEESSDDEVQEVPRPVPQQPQRIQPRGGGKGLFRPQPEVESSEEESEPEPPQQAVRVVGRGGGKSLARMPEPDSSSSEEEEVAKPPPPPQRPVAVQQIRRGGGKSLSAMGGPPQRADSSSSSEESEAEEPEPQRVQVQPVRRGGGKSLSAMGGPPPRVQEPPPLPVVAAPPPVKQEPPKPAPVVVAAAPVALPPPAPKPAPKPAAPTLQVVRSPGGGKALHRPKVVDDDDESEEEFEESDEDSDEDFVEEKKKPAQRPKRKAAPKKIVVDESEEEEDPNAMFDAEDSSDEDEIKELDMNNTKALIQDEKDRKYLDSLTEIEREAILAERFEKAKEKQDMQKAMREARKRKESESKSSKTTTKKLKTANDAKLAKSLDGRRSSGRTRDVNGTKSKKAAALAALKRSRKIQQDYEEESSEESEMDFDDDDDDSDEEYAEDLKPWQKQKKKVAEAKEEEEEGSDMETDRDDENVKGEKSKGASLAVADLEDFKKVVVPRRRLARWCNEPFFNAAVLECFVRLFIGEDDHGEKVYRLCEIVDVEKGKKLYKFPVARKDDKPVSTDKTLRLKFGVSEKNFPMSLVSDAEPTESDLQKYISSQKSNRLELLTKRRASKLRRLQDDLVFNYAYTAEDIERNIEEQKKKGSVGNLGLVQTRVQLAVQAARDRVAEAENRLAESKRELMECSGQDESELVKTVKENTKVLDEAHKELEEQLETEKSLADVVSRRKKKLTGRSKDQDWAKVNRKAYKMNRISDRQGYKSQKEAEARKAAGQKAKFNPYARRKVKPKILYVVGKDAQQKKEPDADDAAATTEVATTQEAVKEPAAPILVQDTVAALAESHQFQIDEEGLVNSTTSLTDMSGVLKKDKRVRVRKGLSIEEYFERKANGTL